MFELVHMGHAHPLESTPMVNKVTCMYHLPYVPYSCGQKYCSIVVIIIFFFYFYIMKIAITVSCEVGDCFSGEVGGI